MQKMRHSILIRASKKEVWKTIWDDDKFRDWAGLIDEGTYKVGELKEGGEMRFINGINGYGVTSLIEKLIPNEFIRLRHLADTVGDGERDKEWTGGTESYSLVENNGVTTLTAEFDVPPEQVGYFAEAYPKALQRVKDLAEE